MANSVDQEQSDLGLHCLLRSICPKTCCFYSSYFCRLNELDFLTEAEAGALRQLQKVYRQENKPPGLRDTSLVSLNGKIFSLNTHVQLLN